MRYKLLFLVGLGIGYVLGARAGRRRYEQIKTLGSKVAASPPVQKAGAAASDQAAQLAESAKRAVSEKVTSAVAEGRAKVEDALGDHLPERLRSEPSAAQNGGAGI